MSSKFVDFNTAKRLFDKNILFSMSNIFVISKFEYFPPRINSSYIAEPKQLILDFEYCEIEDELNEDNEKYKGNFVIPAPTIAEVVDYFSEIKDIFISIHRINDVIYRYTFEINFPTNSTYKYISSPVFDDYNECFLYAINSILDII